MSIYDYRDRPAYTDFDAPEDYCKNEYINSWWTEEHDHIIKSQIETEQWNWSWDITNRLVPHISPEVIENWKKIDPLCKQYAWYNVLLYFSIARAKKIDYLKLIRKPEWKKCELCNNEFIEDSLPYPFIKKLGINNIDFCSPCLKASFLNIGNEKLSKSAIKDFINSLSKLLNKVPPQNYINEISISEFKLNVRIDLLNLLKNRPSEARVKKVFGSWFKALIAANVLEDGTVKNSRGIKCLAKDGHICFSLGEKTLDDCLFEMGFSHSKEPHYPEGNYRGDFLVGNKIIEYYGLIGNPDYDNKIEIKRNLAKKYDLTIIEILPVDLINTEKLSDKLTKKLINLS